MFRRGVLSPHATIRSVSAFKFHAERHGLPLTQQFRLHLRPARRFGNCHDVHSGGFPFRPLHEHRTFVSRVLPPYLVPPVVFVGLVLALWFYKCCMMIVFQNKIIYMPSVPPFSRSEKISDYAKICFPVVWREQKIKSLDGTQIALCIGRLLEHSKEGLAEEASHRKCVKVLYFQGNASSIPPRLPALSNVLKFLARAQRGEPAVDYSIIALSYRGFWTSRGRASQKGIELDAAAALQWVVDSAEHRDNDVKIVLWGQSIGASVATDLTARYSKLRKSFGIDSSKIVGVILETPFLSIRSMLTALYPQKWLPYRYLWPFLRNWWDSEAALRSIAEDKLAQRPRVLILKAERDEVVPSEQALALEALCKELGFDIQRKDVAGALHTEAVMRAEGREAVVHFLAKCASE